MVIVTALIGAFFVIGNIGDAIGAWNTFSDWLYQKFGIPTNYTPITLLLLMIAVLLIAILIELASKKHKEIKRSRRSESQIRMSYLDWFKKM